MLPMNTKKIQKSHAWSLCSHHDSTTLSLYLCIVSTSRWTQLCTKKKNLSTGERILSLHSFERTSTTLRTCLPSFIPKLSIPKQTHHVFFLLSNRAILLSQMILYEYITWFTCHMTNVIDHLTQLTSPFWSAAGVFLVEIILKFLKENGRSTFLCRVFRCHGSNFGHCV